MSVVTDLHPAAQASWRLLATALERERDPRRRANLGVVARHVEQEVRGDMDALMATLVPEPQYSIWGASSSSGPKGREAVVAHYQAMFDSGKSRLEFELIRVVVDDDSVVTEGIFRHAYAGSTLAGRFVPTDEVDPDRWYLVEYRALVLWPISPEGLIQGEEIYAGEPPRIVRVLEQGECPHLGPVARGRAAGTD